MPDTMMQTDVPAPGQSTSIAKLADALTKAQKAFKPISRDREVRVQTKTGGSYTFKYATLDEILGAVRPALIEHGLFVTQGIIERRNGLAIETRLVHSSGEWLGNVTPMIVAANANNQELGSAQSYARRYGISALLCIAVDEDDDGNTADGNHREYKPQPGTAGGGGNFRPSGPRRFSMDKAKGETDAPNGGGAPKPKEAPVPDNAIKRVEWVKASVAALSSMDKAAATDWWASEKKRIGVIETALPTEYERLLDAYNEALDRGEAA